MFVSYLYIIVYGGAFIGLCHWKFTNMMSYKLVFGLVVALYCIWCEQHRRCHSGHVSPSSRTRVALFAFQAHCGANHLRICERMRTYQRALWHRLSADGTCVCRRTARHLCTAM